MYRSIQFFTLLLIFFIVGCAVDINPGSGVISVNPRSNNFGEVNIGESVQATFKVKNNSAEDINISTALITGMNAGDFDFLSDDFTSMPLTAGEERDIIIAFSPRNLGDLEATLELTHEAEGSPVEVELKGEGQLGNEVVLVPETLDFEVVTIGESRILDLTIGNGTDSPVQIDLIELDGFNKGDFEIIAGGTDFGSFTIPSKELHNVTISFMPTEIGYREAYVTVEYGSGMTPLEASLVGNGTLSSGFEVTPEMYDYADVGINASVNADFMITNTGNSQLAITGISIFETGVPFEITAGQVDGSPFYPVVYLNPGLTHEFTITFTPTDIDSYQATFKVGINSDPEAFTGQLLGNGSDQVSLSPSQHDFGQISISKQSDPFTFSVTNPTMDGVVITSITIGGMDASAFAVLTPAPLTVDANGGVQEIDVTFTPTQDGPHSATLEITLDTSDQLFGQLYGEGSSSPEFSISPPCGSTYDYGMIPFNSSKSADFTITNVGSGFFTVTAIAIQNDTEKNFKVVSGGTTPFDVESTPQVIKIEFSPQSVGPKSATLKIDYEIAPGSPCYITLTGEAATVNITPTSHNFADVIVGGTPVKKVFTVTNNTVGDIYIQEIKITGTDAGDFSASPSGDNLSIQILPGKSFEIEVTCTASKMGALSATLEVKHSLSGEYLKVPLTANGAGNPELKVTPASYDYGTLELKTPEESKSKVFEIENTGTGFLKLTAALTIVGTNASDFTITDGGDNYPTEGLGPGQKHEITVEFKPAHYGSKSASIEIAHNGVSPSSPYNVQLQGNAIGPDFILVPDVTAYAMGDARIGKAKRKGFYIKNVGNRPLNVTAISLTNTTDFKLEHANPSYFTGMAGGSMGYFYLDFIPQSAGNKSTTLRIVHNSVASPREVTISGTGIGGSDEIDEDFEAGTGGWALSGSFLEHGTVVPITDGPSSAHSGTKCIGTDLNGYQKPGWNGFIASPILDMSKSLAPKLSFYMWLHTWNYTTSPNYYGCAWVELSTDGGVTWTNSLSPTPAFTNNYTINGASKSVWAPPYSSNPGYPFKQWVKVDIDLSAAAGKSGVQVAIYFHSGTSAPPSSSSYYNRAGLYVDDINIYDSASPFPMNPCPQDNDFTTKVSGSTYKLKWDCEGATSYDVYFGTTNPPTNKVGNAITTKEQTVSVAADRKYFWRVEAKGTAVTYKSQTFYFETVSTHPKVLINELETGSNDWIEFYNPGSTPVYIGGYQCTIYSKNNSSPDGKFTVPMYYYLEPGGLIVFQDSNSSISNAETVDFDFDWDNSTHAIEVILQKHEYYPNTGVDYMRVNTLTASHKPTDLSWSGTAASNNASYYNWYRNSGTDTDTNSDWSVKAHGNANAKNPGQ